MKFQFTPIFPQSEYVISQRGVNTYGILLPRGVIFFGGVEVLRPEDVTPLEEGSARDGVTLPDKAALLGESGLDKRKFLEEDNLVTGPGLRVRGLTP